MQLQRFLRQWLYPGLGLLFLITGCSSPQSGPTGPLPPSDHSAQSSPQSTPLQKSATCEPLFPRPPECEIIPSPADGKLAFINPHPPYEGQVVILDLAPGTARAIGSPPTAFYGSSPSGKYWLIAETLPSREMRYAVYDNDGNLQSRISESLAYPPLWGPEDRLGLVTLEGALLSGSPSGERIPVLSENSLGSRPSQPVVSAAGDWAWTPGSDALLQTNTSVQLLYFRPVGAAENQSQVLSSNFQEHHYSLLAWVPSRQALLLAGGLPPSASLWADGVPLSTANLETRALIDLHAWMLVTPEAYDWHPTRRGWLALAEGAGRFIGANKRLALLDSNQGTLTYLTGPEQAVFEPRWSPDGTWLAYVAAPDRPEATGDGTAMEQALAGRALYIINPESGESRRLTNPGNAIDGWPRWTADGAKLLYTRQHDGQTEIRIVTREGTADTQLVAGLQDPTCWYGGCRWSDWLDYHP